MTNSAHDPDLDPLIRPSRAKGTIINRREHRLTHLEKWGRIRLAIISLCLFFVIYVCFAASAWSDQRPQIIVNIPPNDESLPGPFGKFCYLKEKKLLWFWVISCSRYHKLIIYHTQQSTFTVQCIV